jgi:hypothetical protein
MKFTYETFGQGETVPTENALPKELWNQSEEVRRKVLDKFAREVAKSARIRLALSANETARRNGYQQKRPSGGGQFDTRYGNVRMRDQIFWQINPDATELNIDVGGVNGRVDAEMQDKDPSQYTVSIGTAFFSYQKMRWMSKLRPRAQSRVPGKRFFTGAVEATLPKIPQYLADIV